MIGFLYVIEVVVCLLLALVVMLQKPKEGGLGGLAGQMGEAVFGADAGNVLIKATIWLGTIFLVNTLLLARLTSTIHSKSVMAGEKPAAPIQRQMPQLPTEACGSCTRTCARRETTGGTYCEACGSRGQACGACAQACCQACGPSAQACGICCEAPGSRGQACGTCCDEACGTCCEACGTCCEACGTGEVTFSHENSEVRSPLCQSGLCGLWRRGFFV